MRKVGCRHHRKKVFAAPKERRCGVPCTLLVTAWSLFLLLLLTSSISHRDDQDKVLEESGFRTQELTGEHLVGECDTVGGFVDVISTLGSSSPPPIFVDRELQPDGFLSNGNDKEEPSSSDRVILPTRIASPNCGENIDALHYAEYGAGLLQKSGPAQEVPKICLIGNSGGANCRVISQNGEFVGQKCVTPQVQADEQGLLCLNEFLAEERCHDAVSYGADIVAELEPGESYLVCHTDSQRGTVFCEVACMSQSECFLSGLDSKLCRHDLSIRDVFRSACQLDPGLGQFEVSIADSVSSSEMLNLVEGEHLQASSPTTVRNDVDLSPAVTDVGGDSALDSSSVQEGDLGQNAQHGILVEDFIEQSTVDNSVTEVIDVDILRNSDAKVELSSSSELKNQLTDGESGFDEPQNPPPAEDGTGEERVVDDEPISTPVEIEFYEEPSRLKRVGSVMSLEEYKKSILESQRSSGSQLDLSSVQTQKMRHSDESYNYAASSHGAKVLAFNKEAKGASHILLSDKDKYLRNPCGVEDKHVVLELSEETFVDTLSISNFEFHSSNLKDFELLGSPVYPAKDWISLGKFQAENVRTRQKFNIEDPKWVRYLMLKMLTHWGSEFFCTLSVVEVYGVDVIKNLLDDWIALEDVDNNGRSHGASGHVISQEETATAGTGQQTDKFADAVAVLDAPFSEPLFNQPLAENRIATDQGIPGGRDVRGSTADGQRADEDSKGGSTADSAQEITHNLGGKPPGDSVLKILMQKVKALEQNQTLFDSYLGDMNQKYKVMLSELDKDLGLVTERLRNETALTASLALRLADREMQRKEEKLYMEHRFAQIASNFTDNLDFMRWQIQSMERREIMAIMLALLCMILAAFLHLLACCLPRRTAAQDFSMQKISEEMEGKLDNPSLSSFCHGSSSLILYLACGLTVVILSV